MAKHKQLWLKGSKGKLAGTTFYQTAGVTIQREINYDPSNPRTDKQMSQRTKLSNLVNMYRAGKSFFPRAFENKKALESDYNKFVSMNLTTSPVHLTKGESSKGYFVPAAYVISQGSLLSPGTVTNASGTVTYGSVYGGSFSANTTVAEYTAGLIANHSYVQSGDQLSFIVFNTEGDNCYVAMMELILDLEDSRKLSDVLPDSFDWVPASGIVYDNNGVDNAGAVVLSRTVAGKTLVSSATLVASQGDAYTAHTGDAALTAAINSYGASKKVFLDNK